VTEIEPVIAKAYDATTPASEVGIVTTAAMVAGTDLAAVTGPPPPLGRHQGSYQEAIDYGGSSE
jgi:hypothetical protein